MTYICTNDKFCPNRPEAFNSVEHFQQVVTAICGEAADIRESAMSHDWYDSENGEIVLQHCAPGLYDYATGDYIREATTEELDRSLEDEALGGQGAFDIDGRTVYAIND